MNWFVTLSAKIHLQWWNNYNNGLKPSWGDTRWGGGCILCNVISRVPVIQVYSVLQRSRKKHKITENTVWFRHRCHGIEKSMWLKCHRRSYYIPSREAFDVLLRQFDHLHMDCWKCHSLQFISPRNSRFFFLLPCRSITCHIPQLFLETAKLGMTKHAEMNHR